MDEEIGMRSSLELWSLEGLELNYGGAQDGRASAFLCCFCANGRMNFVRGIW